MSRLWLNVSRLCAHEKSIVMLPAAWRLSANNEWYIQELGLGKHRGIEWRMCKVCFSIISKTGKTVKDIEEFKNSIEGWRFDV